MGRLTGFIARAGDVVQQAGQEYQRSRAGTQQQQQQPSPGVQQPQRASYMPSPSPQPQVQQQQQPPQPQYGYEQQQQGQYPQHQQYHQEDTAALLKQYEEQMQRNRHEAERLQREHDAQMERARREAERLQREYDAHVERARLEAEGVQRELDAADKAEQDRLAAQVELDRRAAERLAEQYAAEDEASREMERLRLDVPPAMPPRPVSGVYMVPPPPPPRPTSWAPGSYPPPPPRAGVPELRPAALSPTAAYAPASTVAAAGPGGYAPYSPAGERQQEQIPQQVYHYPPPPPVAAPAPANPSPSIPYTPTSPTATAASPSVYTPYIPSVERQSEQPAQQVYYTPPPPVAAPASAAPSPSTPYTPVTPDTTASPSQYPPYNPTPDRQQQPQPHHAYSPPSTTPIPEIKTERPVEHVRAPDPAPPVATPSNPPPSRPQTPTRHACGVTPVTECVDALVTFALDWFTHPAAPSFLVCSRCYVDHIYSSPFRDSFSLQSPSDKQPRKCHFSAPRMKDALWPAAVATRSLGQAVEFMQVRVKVAHCQELKPLKDQYWYTTPDIPQLTICEPCYHDRLMSAPQFGTHFVLEKSAAAQACRFGHCYIRRMFETHSKTDNWTAFATETKARLTFPACPKAEAVRASERTWFISKRGPQGLQICLACYSDYFFDTPNAAFFEQTQPGKFARAKCAMGSFSIVLPARAAVNRKDWALFWRAIDGVAKHQHCDAGGTKGTSWLTLRSDPRDFHVCGACVAGIAEPLGAARYFVPKPRASESDTLLCCFNLAHPRALEYLRRLEESVVRGTWRPLGDFAAVFSAVPKCPRDDAKRGQSRRYWGWENVQVCEECYVDFARGTALEARFARTGEVVAGPTICDMYTTRMRGFFAETCATGDVASLLTLGAHRRQVFAQTVPVCERLLAQQRMAAAQAQAMGAMGTSYAAMGGMMDVTMGHSYTVGNAALGYGFANTMSLQGAAYNQQMVQLSAQVRDPGMMMQVKVLEDRWRSVE